MQLFIDTEFTAFRDGQLLSLGAVCDNGKEFYAEIVDAKRARQAPFVEAHVLSQFGCIDGAQVTGTAHLGERLGEFLATTGESSIELCYDYRLDERYFFQVLQRSRHWGGTAHRIKPFNIGAQAYTLAGRVAQMRTFSAGAPLRRHHALLDARALKAAWLARHNEIAPVFGHIWLFLTNEAPAGPRGMHADILAWSDDKLEHCHDYIQWLFPLDEASRFNPDAPVLTPRQCRELGQDRLVMVSLRSAFERMLAFYGLQDDGVQMTQRADWSSRGPLWAAQATHNDLRLSRILRCLRLFGAQDEARRLFSALQRIVAAARGMQAAPTLQYWAQAAAC